MFIYYDKDTLAIFAIAEKQIVVPPKKTIFVVEYNGDIPEPIHKFLFDGGKFISRPRLDLVLEEQENQNKYAREYLFLTDWYVTRFLETGEKIPKNISASRKEAREKIITPKETEAKFYKENPSKKPLDYDDSGSNDGMNDHGMKRV